MVKEGNVCNEIAAFNLEKNPSVAGLMVSSKELLSIEYLYNINVGVWEIGLRGL